MARVCRVLSGDPMSVAAALDTLAATEEILIVEKTFSSGDFIVVSDNAAGTGQDVIVAKGDPATVATLLNGGTIDIICPTFSASQYIVVER